MGILLSVGTNVHRDKWDRDMWGRDIWGRDMWDRDLCPRTKEDSSNFGSDLINDYHSFKILQ